MRQTGKATSRQRLEDFINSDINQAFASASKKINRAVEKAQQTEPTDQQKHAINAAVARSEDLQRALDVLYASGLRLDYSSVPRRLTADMFQTKPDQSRIDALRDAEAELARALKVLNRESIIDLHTTSDPKELIKKNADKANELVAETMKSVGIE